MKKQTIEEFKQQIADMVVHFGNTFYWQEKDRRHLSEDLDRFVAKTDVFFLYDFVQTYLTRCSLNIAANSEREEGKLYHTIEVAVSWPSAQRTLVESTLSVALYEKVLQLAMLIQAQADEFGKFTLDQ